MALDGNLRAQLNTITKAAQAMTLPAPITEAMADLDTISANRATIAAEAAKASAAAQDAAREGKLTLTLAGKTSAAADATRILDTAEYEAAQLVLTVNRQHADNITDTIRETMFTPALEALEDVAARTSTGDTVESLMKAGRDADARALVDASKHYNTLNEARTHRSYHFTSTTRNHPNRAWKNPEQVRRELDNTMRQPEPAYRFLDALRAGGQAWMPTNAELNDLTKQTQKAHEEKQRAALKGAGDRFMMV